MSGEKDAEGASKSVGNAVVLMIICSVVLLVIFMIGREQILTMFGATENNISYAREYFDVILIGIPFFIFTNGMNSIIRADGSPQFAMLSTLAGCIINVILDPIAIFVLHWGVAGAALATIAGQIVSTILALYYIFHAKSFRLNKASMCLKAVYLNRILLLGISSFLTQLSIVVIMGVMNTTLVKYGALSDYGADIPMTVMGIVMKIFQIVIAIVVGIAAGSQPIVGFNYGTGLYTRVKKIYITMIAAEIMVGAIATVIFECFPVQIISLFGSEEGLYNQFAKMSVRIFLSTLILCCVVKATSIFLQSLGKPVMSMSLSLLRDFVLSVPLVLWLPTVFGFTGPLYSGPVADTISCIVAVVMIINVCGKIENNGI